LVLEELDLEHVGSEDSLDGKAAERKQCKAGLPANHQSAGLHYSFEFPCTVLHMALD